MALRTLLPVIPYRIGKHRSIFILIGSHYCSVERFWSVIPCLFFYVKRDVGTITAIAVESIVCLIKSEAMHRVDGYLLRLRVIFLVIIKAFCLSDAFILWIGLIMATTLYRPNTETLTISEAIDCWGSEIKLRFNYICGFELLLLEAVLQIPHMDQSGLVCSDKEGPGAGHEMHRHRHVYFFNTMKLSERLPRPESDHSIVTSRYNYTETGLRQ